MDIKTVRNDQRDGLNESKDCTVRALATALGIPYRESHELLRVKAGRKRGKGIPFGRFMDEHRLWLQERYRVSIWAEVVDGKRKYRTLNQVTKVKGTFIVLVKRHVLAVIDGVAYDSIDTLRNYRTRAVWKVTPLN